MCSEYVSYYMCVNRRFVPISFQDKVVTVKCHEMTDELEDDLKFMFKASEVKFNHFASIEDEQNHLDKLKLKQMPTVKLHPKSIECPRCSSNEIINILYGLPDEEAIELAEQGKVILGGCDIDPDLPGNHCGKCKYEWTWI